MLSFSKTGRLTLGLFTLLLVSHCGYLGAPGTKLKSGATVSGGITPPGGGDTRALALSIPAAFNSCSTATVTYLVGAQATAVSQDTRLALFAAAGAGFYSSGSSCDLNSAVTQVTIPARSSSASFRVKFTVAGTYSISAAVLSGDAANAAQVSITVVNSTPTVPTRLALTAASGSISVNACVAVTASLFNAASQPASFSSSTTLTPTIPATPILTAATGRFFIDQNCPDTDARTSFGFPANQATGVFFFKRTTAGTSAIRAVAAGLAGDLTLVAQASGPTRLSISGPSSVDPGVCSPAYTVGGLDASGTPAGFSNPTTVSLNLTGNGTFHNVAGCGSGSNVTSVSLASGALTTNFFFKATSGTSAGLQASASGVTDGSKTVAINSSGGTGHLALVYTEPTGGFTTGTCHGPIQVQVHDQSGTPLSNLAQTTVQVSASLHGALYSAGCNTTPITSIMAFTDFYFKDLQSETSVILARATGFADDSASFNVGAAPNNNLALVATPQSVAAGATVQFTVAFTDANNNLTPVATQSDVSFTVAGSTTGLFYDAACQELLPTNGQGRPYLRFAVGAAQNFFCFKDTKVGNPTVTGMFDTISGHQSLAITAAAPAKLALASGPVNVPSGGCSLQPFNFRLLDTYDNATASTVPSLAFTITPVGGNFYSSATCAGATTNLLSFSQGEGTKALGFLAGTGANCGGTLTGNSFAALTVSAVISTGAAGTPTEIRLVRAPAPTFPPGDRFRAGQCLPYEIKFLDGSGNPATPSSLVNVILASSATGAFYRTDVECRSVNGVPVSSRVTTFSSTPIYFKGRRASTYSLEAHAEGLNWSPTYLELNAGPAATLNLTGPARVSASVCSGPYTFRFADQFGNTTSAPGLTLTLSGASNGRTYSESPSEPCSTERAAFTTVSPFVTLSFYFKDNQVENPTLVASSSNGMEPYSFSIDVFQSSPPAAFTTTLVAGNNQVSVSFPVTSGVTYVINRRLSTVGTWTDTGGRGSTYIDREATNGNMYYYQVAATNTAGTTYSYAGPVTPTSGAPGNFALNPIVPGNTTARVSFGASAGATIYELYRGTISTSVTELKSGSISPSGYRDTFLTNGTTYYYKVRAKNAAGLFTDSNILPVTPIGLPANFAATLTPGDGRVTVSFALTADTTYAISRRASTTLTWTPTTGTGTGYIDTGVNNYTAYYYRLAVTNGSGVATTIDSGPVTPTGHPPAFTTTLTPGHNQVTVTFPVLTGATYLIYRRPSTTLSWSLTTGTATGFIDTGATYGTNYYYRVLATISGMSTPSEAGPVMPLVPNVPPGTFTASVSPGNTTATITFTASSGATTYELYRGTTSSTASTVTELRSGNISTTGYKDTFLINGTLYYYKVRAKSAPTLFTDSNVVSVRSVGLPANFAVTVTPGNNQVTVTFPPTPPTPDTTFAIFRRLASGATFTFTPGAGSGFVDNAVTNGTAYVYRVDATNGSGVPTPYTSASVTPFSVPSITATPVVFGDQTTTISSTARTATIYNSGTTNARYISTTLINQVNGAALNVGGNSCAGVIPANGSCTVNISFSPNSTVTSTANLDIAWDSPTVAGGANQHYTGATVSGRGVTPALLAYSSGPQTIGMGGGWYEALSYPSGTLTIINNGGTTATNLNGTWTGPNASDFSFPSTVVFPGFSGSCLRGGSLAPGATCTAKGSLTGPMSNSSRTGTLTMTYNTKSNGTGPGSSVVGRLVGSLSAPVYRMYRAANGDHLYTLIAGEGAALGYVAELAGARAFGVTGDCGACVGAGACRSLNRCTLNGFHYVGGGSCDQGGNLESIYGYACTNSVTPGVVPLYRKNRVGNLINTSTSIAEGNNLPFPVPLYVHP